MTQKIALAVAGIKLGLQTKLVLGNTSVRRDWGWAPEYVEAMHAMLQLSQPDDFVIATGRTCSLQEFVEVAFTHLGLDYQQHVTIDNNLFRPTEIQISRGDATKAAKILNWQAKTKMPEVARRLVDDCVRELSAADKSD